MYFQVNALKQEGEQSVNFTFIIDTESEEKVREIIQKYAIIVLSIQKFTQEATTFGNICIEFRKDGENEKLITQGESYEGIVNLCISSGFNVLRVDSTKKDLSEEQSRQIIEGIQNQLKMKKEAEEERKHIEAEKQKQEFGSKTQQKMLEVVEEVLTDIGTIKEKIIGNASGADIKKLNQMEDDLKKLRMGSNTDKITGLLEELFVLMEKLEMNHIEAIKEEQKSVIRNSSVSDLDIVSEYDKFKKAKKVGIAGTTASKEDTYYIATGKLGIFLRFFQKDFGEKTGKVSEMLQGFMNFIEYISIFLAINLPVFIMFEKIQGNIVEEKLYVYLIHAGSIGLAMTLAKIIKFNNMFAILIRICLSGVLYIFLINLCMINFAL